MGSKVKDGKRSPVKAYQSTVHRRILASFSTFYSTEENTL